jgi:hypothetical protein
MAYFSRAQSNGVQLVAGVGGVQMVMLVRNRKEYFMDFIAREAKAQQLKMVINGSFVSLSRLTKLWTYGPGTDPLDPSESQTVGQVIQGGKLISGTSSAGKFQFSQNTCGVEQFSAGPGDPGPTACAAVGGVAPIVIAGLPYGSANLYRSGVPAGAPLTGEVSAKFKPYLTQKSNAMFTDLQSEGSTLGKTAVGYSSRTKTTFVVVQQSGTSGLDADGVRTVFTLNNADNAVFLDCSDSATLYYDGTFLVTPGENKNEFLTVAVGFK